MATPTKPQISPHAAIGVFVALIGVLFTLDNLNVVDAHNFFQYWPLLPIGIGLLFLAQADELEDWGRGAVWLAIGGVFLARSLGYLPFNPLALWPLLLVLVGIKLVWGARNMDCAARRERRAERLKRRDQHWEARIGHEGTPEDERDVFGLPRVPNSGTKYEPVTDPWAPFPTEADPPAPGAASSASTPSSGATSSGAADPWRHTYHGFAPGSTQPGTQTDPQTGAPRTEPPPLPRYDHTSGPDADAAGRGRDKWNSGSAAASRVTLFALMSGMSRRVHGLFRGGQLSAIMGGIELDLRGAHLEDTAVIDTLAFWGGIEIFVPEDWVVVNQGFALMGGFDDSTKSGLPGNRPHLIVKGIALMGGVEIKVKKDSWWKRKQ